jgi:hypothetical protein
MYLVSSAFTSSPISLIATTKSSVIFFIVCVLAPNSRMFSVLRFQTQYKDCEVYIYSEQSNSKKAYSSINHLILCSDIKINHLCTNVEHKRVGLKDVA